MRVLYVSKFDPEASSDGLYAFTLANALEAAGVEVVRGVIRDPNAHALDRNGPASLALGIQETAAKEGVDVVHLHYEPGLFPPRAAWGIARRSAALPPLVLTIHRVAAYSGRLRPAGMRQGRAVWQEWLLARKARKILCHAAHSAAILRRRYARVSCGSHPMIVPIDECDTTGRKGGFVLFLGNHHPGKGLVEFASAMQTIPEVPAVIAGLRNPKWASYNARVARELERAPNVRVEDGWVSMARKHELLCGARMVALPYTSPGSGSLVHSDAIGHLRPVVASQVQPLRSLVEGAGTGETVSILDTRAFAGAIKRVAGADPSPFGEGLARARQEGSPASVANAVRAAYEEVLR